MFQSLEYKHPKFYQVFRLFIVFFALSTVMLHFCMRGICAVLPKRQACFREDFPDCRFYYSRSG